MKQDLKDKQVQLWPSVARLAAMLWIFIYHFTVMLDIPRPTYFRSIYAIMVFCFLSGYFGVSVQNAPAAWLKKRYFRIMVPYWIVMVGMITINFYIQYKPVDTLEIMILLAGGSLFLNDPLYIISWFITLILLLYVALYLFVIIPIWFRWFFLLFLLYLSTLIPYATFYFISFFIGFFVREKCTAVDTSIREHQQLYRKLNFFLFTIQAYTYHFFLVHGLALHFFIREIDKQPVLIFVGSLLLSCIAAVCLYRVESIVIKTVMRV